MSSMHALKGNITALEVDAIVNAANHTLLGGGGVDGAIHRAAGPRLLEECRRLGGCPTGEARITAGYRLPAKHIIHTVGPVWRGGGSEAERLLASCYESSLQLACERGLRSIAFPCISTGAYGYPGERAARTAVASVSGYLRLSASDLDVTFCCFSDFDLAIYRSLLSAVYPFDREGVVE